MSELIMTLREWQTFVKPLEEIIVQASTIDGCDGLTNSSIGMCYEYSKLVKNLNESEYISTQIGNHCNVINCSINSTTDQRKRSTNSINRSNILKTLEINNICNNLIDNSMYYFKLPNYKFVISPEGNGIDCHRHYESLMAGCIPIIEKENSEIIENKYGNVPILYTTDYSEITEEYLENIYDEYLDKQFNFSKLYISNWSQKDIQLIKHRGNFWCTKMNVFPHYTYTE